MLEGAHCNGPEEVEGFEEPAFEVARAVHRAHPAVRIEPTAFWCFSIRRGNLSRKEASTVHMYSHTSERSKLEYARKGIVDDDADSKLAAAGNEFSLHLPRDGVVHSMLQESERP